MNDLEVFFEELKKQHAKEGQQFEWDWDELKAVPGCVPSDFLEFVAFNFAKNVLHGPLPNNLHSRMILSCGEWPKKYVEYLEK